MSIRNQNWYNLQATRRYPLDDSTTGDDDTGAAIRDDILVDCHIRFPSTFGNYLYLQGINVSATLVTLVFGASETLDSATTTTVAAVSLLKPVEPSINYPIRALQPGVSGWVTFGRGLDTPFSGKYSTPRQTFIGHRNARPYTPLPIPTVGKLGVADALSGVVNIVADTPMTVTYYDAYELPKYDPETNTTNSAPVRALVFSCVAPSAEFNPYTYFLGPCGQRPESGTCNKTPIETINGVAPDCETGNINIVVGGGLTARPFIDCGGLDITTPLGLSFACDSVPPGERQRQDICCPNDDGESEFCWPDVIPTSPAPQTLRAYPTLPLHIDFHTAAPASFTPRAGVFSAVEKDDKTTYCAQSRTNMNIALCGPCPSDWAFGRTVSAVFQFDNASLRHNAGVILNYITVRENGAPKTKYIFAALDADRGAIVVYRCTGDLLVKENEITVDSSVRHQYCLTARADLDDVGQPTITVTLHNVTTDAPVVQFQTSVAEYDTADGQFGVATDAATVYFTTFEIQ